MDIPGITILDKDEIKEGFTAYDVPLLAPRPNDFVSSPQIQYVTLGSGAGRQLDVSYFVTYRYFHAPIGTGDLSTTWSEMIDAVFSILDVVIDNDKVVGLEDFSLSSIGDFCEVVDGSNNSYHGCDITFKVLEFVN